MAEPIVFVPGLLCTDALYAPQIAALADHPIMVANNRDDTSINAIAARLLEAAPDRFALIGLSMGGYIAMEVMRTAPDRVSKLALLNTSARADTEEQSRRRSTLVKMATEKSFERVPELLFPGFVHEKNESNVTLKSAVVEMAVETGPDAFVRQQRANADRIDSRPYLKSIDCSTLVLTGDGDRLLPPELSVEIRERVPQSKLVMIEECGHLSTLEDPQRVTAELGAFLTAK
ncbi:alpha/beta fold hydrolase [uncultured Roseibium sp.]|uniref:alpha/beta fold hydrolase n=1 Tax=uncultured Roseibium sp. TaxID=1936171 RepID=UPI002632E834|nr:alpha/beta fold hydrolase [uncultured Roseibium sp.]